MSRLTDFYRGSATDCEGRTLAEVWSWDDEELEADCEWVPWLFPLPEPGPPETDAPRLTDEDVAAFRSDERMRDDLRRSYLRFLSFLGFERTPQGEVVEGANFADRVPDVWRYPNHNWRRIARALRSLRLLGLEPEAASLFRRLYRLREGRVVVRADALACWAEARYGPPHFSGRRGRVSVWVATRPLAEVPRDYFREGSGGPGGEPFSRFCRDFGFVCYDPDCEEYLRSDVGPAGVRELLSRYPYSASFADAAADAARRVGTPRTELAILLYRFEYDPHATGVTRSDCFVFLGCFDDPGDVSPVAPAPGS